MFELRMNNNVRKQDTDINTDQYADDNGNSAHHSGNGGQFG